MELEAYRRHTRPIPAVRAPSDGQAALLESGRSDLQFLVGVLHRCK